MTVPRIGALRIVAWSALAPTVVLAQDARARSRDYLMLATVDDVRATWVNPAGLAKVMEASVMAELVVDRALDGTLHLGQYTLGMNSRGLSLSYLRDRIPDTVSVSIWRLGFAIPFRYGSMGLAISQYRSLGQDEGLDFGARFSPTTGLDVGLVTRNVSRPLVRGIRLPLTGSLGVAWSPVRDVIHVAAEAEVMERLAASGSDRSYRGVFQVVPRNSAVGVITAFDFDDDLSVARWTLGIRIGGTDSGGIFASASPAGNLGRVDQISAVGVASRRGPGMMR